MKIKVYGSMYLKLNILYLFLGSVVVVNMLVPCYGISGRIRLVCQSHKSGMFCQRSNKYCMDLLLLNETEMQKPKHEKILQEKNNKNSLLFKV